MEYCEVKAFIKMKEEINSDKMYAVLNSYINFSILEDKRLSQVHKKNLFKFYVFGLPFPIERDRIYKKDKIYSFNIRSANYEIVMRIGRVLKRATDLFTLEGVSYNNYKIHNIEKLITLTPIVVTMQDGKYWKKEDGEEELIKRLSMNGEKKLRAYYNSCDIERGHQFIEGVKQINNRLIIVPYKEACLFGNKFEIQVKQDTASQLIAGMVTGVGIGEKNTIGMGYCKAIWRKEG